MSEGKNDIAPSLQPTRRALIAGAVALGAPELAPFVRPARVAGHATDHDAAPPACPINPDPILAALFDEYGAAEAALAAVNDAHTPIEAAYLLRRRNEPDADRDQLARETGFDKAQAAQGKAVKAVHAIVDRITAVPARTFEGLHIKADVSATELNLDTDLLASLVDDVRSQAAALGKGDPATFDDYADVRFDGVVFESGDEAVQSAKRLYDDTWPVVAIMALALQQDQDGLVDFIERCEAGGSGKVEAIVSDVRESQLYLANLADLMGKFHLRLLAAHARAAKRRTESW